MNRVVKLLPAISDDIVSNIKDNNSFKESVEELTESLYDNLSKEKEKEKKKRLFTLDQIDTLSKIISIKYAEKASFKFQSKVTEWLIFDSLNGIFRIRASVIFKDIKRKIYISLGPSIKIKWLNDNKFLITNKDSYIVYDDDVGDILEYKV